MKRLNDLLVAGAAAQQWTEGHLLALPEAEIHVAVGGQPHSIASRAEMFRQRGDKADAKSSTWCFHVPGRSSAGDVGRDEPAFLLQAPPDWLEVEVLGISTCCPHRHRLDQTKNK